MLTCKQFDEFMIDYIEGNLPLRQKISCGLHFRMCRNCARFVEQYRRVILLEKNAYLEPDNSIPEEIPEELLKAALSHVKQR